MKVMIIF